MNLSNEGRRAILISCACFLAVPLVLVVPLSVVGKSTSSLWPTVVLLLLQFGAAYNVDVAFARVIRREVPGFPLKLDQYSASQRAWRTAGLAHIRSRWPIWGIYSILSIALISQAFRVEQFAVWLLTLAPSSRYCWEILLSGCGLAIAATLGIWMGNRRIQYAAELMNQ